MSKKKPTISARQIRAARALLDWTQAELAGKAELSVMTIGRMEERGPSSSTAANVETVRRALEEEGVVFLGPDEDPGGGVGVVIRE